MHKNLYPILKIYHYTVIGRDGSEPRNTKVLRRHLTNDGATIETNSNSFWSIYTLLLYY